MVVGLVFEKITSIGANRHGKFMFGGEKMSIKDVPFVRYRFEEYGEAEVNFIKASQEMFKLSCHLIEVVIKHGYIETTEMLREAIPNAAIYHYLTICDLDVENEELRLDSVSLMNQSKNYFLADRLMLKDKSTSLHMVAANKIKQQIFKEYGIPLKNIGICSSPLSFGEDCCLTAERARELAAKYTESFDCVLPSANHEGMNGCGCLRYMIVTGPLVEVELKTGGATKKKKESTSSGGVDTSRFGELFQVDGQLGFDESGKIEEDTNKPEKKPKKTEKKAKLPRNVMKLWN